MFDNSRRAGDRIYVPPGWPEVVRPPGASDWEATAVSFLLDCCPADYRRYAVLQRHPVVLAQFACAHVAGQLQTSRDGLAVVRSSLTDLVDVRVLDAAAEAWQAEAARLVRVRRAVGLVEEALRGRVFVRKL